MGKINMETLSKQNRQSRDTTLKYPSAPSDNGLFQSENFIQPMTQPSTSALDEASRDAETFGSMGEATFDAHSKHPTRTLSYKVIQWPFIEFIELQDLNYKLEFPHQHPRKEEKDYNGSELIISKDGYDNLMMMHIEVKKRTPESRWDGSEYTYDRDCEAYYGIMEVLENQVR